ncbi:MAG: hypothetical protein HUU16_00745 [Candidatus Omnitrophica bacterium]|nr:hypothetical protein [Candidatus Omnitrophota bacterium]
MNIRLPPAPIFFVLVFISPPSSGCEDSGRSVWIEEAGTVARVLLKTPTQTQQLVEAARGELLDVTHSRQGAAWSKWNGSDWDIQVWRAGHVQTLGRPGRDDGQPVIWEKGVAWISAHLMDVRVISRLWTGESETLPGVLAENLASRARGLSWVSWSPRGPKAWLFDEQGARQVQPEAPPLEASRAEEGIESDSSEWTALWAPIGTHGPPLPRTTHATVQVATERLVVFGGEVWDESCTQFLGLDNVLWTLDLVNGKWVQTAPEPSPSKRCHTPLAIDPTRRLALLWGGAGLNTNGEIELLDDTWLLDTTALRWTEVSTSVQPKAGADAGLVHDPTADRFLLFRRGEVWEFQTAEKRWVKLDISPGPPPREAVTVALDPTTRKVLFFGGNAGSRYFEDTWILDLSTAEWREIRNGPHPSARVRVAHALDRERRIVALYGGVLGPYSSRKSDLWVFDFESERWSLAICQGSVSPGPRGGFHGMGFDPSSGVFTLFGGRSDSVRHHNDVWRLKLERRSR